jgi:hypothetical protein
MQNNTDFEHVDSLQRADLGKQGEAVDGHCARRFFFA